METLGLIAGNGRLPFMLAESARERGISVRAVAHRGETDPALEERVDRLTWVRVGQVNRIERWLKGEGVCRVMLAGGIGHVRALREARPDLGALRIIRRLR